METSRLFMHLFNNYPSNITFEWFQWSKRYSYTNNSASYSGHKYHLVLDPQFDSDDAGELTAIYNTTKNFAETCPQGATVYSSSSTTNDLVAVTCKKGNMHNTIVINKGSEAINLTLNLENFTESTIYDLETKTAYTVTDNSTNIGSIDQYEIIYLGSDLEPPEITIDSPSNTTYSSSTTYFNITLNEEGSLCYYSLDGASNITMTKQGTVTKFEATNSTMSDGSHTVDFSCNDTWDNWNSTSVTFLIDTTAPNYTIVTPLNDTYYNESEINITTNLTDNLGIQNATYYIYNDTHLINETTTSFLQGVQKYTLGIVFTLADGVYQWFVKVTDWAGNLVQSDNKTLTIDTEHPPIEFVGPTPSDNTNQTYNSIYVNYTTSDTNDIYSFTNFDSSLVGYWRFEGNVNDESGYGNDGTVIGAELVSNGRFGQAYEFDGDDDKITISMDDSRKFNGQPFSGSAWVNMNTNDDEVLIELGLNWAGNLGYMWKSGASGKQKFYSGSSHTDSTTTVSTNQWNHVAFMMNGTHVHFYLNGVPDGVQTLAIKNDSAETIWNIGAEDTAHDFNGTIDEVMIFNRSLSAEEITALYNSSMKYHNFTNLDQDSTHTIQSYVIDQAGNKNETGLITVKIDAFTPQFSTFEEVPANNSVYTASQTYKFNSTIINTNGTAGIEFDGTNYSASNVSDEYTITLPSDLPVGVYSYKWWSFGNGSLERYNESSTFIYAVQKAAPSGSIAGTPSITYPTTGDVTGSESNNGDSDVNYKLYRNGTEVSNPDNSLLAVGYYSYIYNSTEGANYTVNSSLDTFGLIININTSSCQAYFNETSPLDVNEAFVIYTNCTSSYDLYRNGTSISNNTQQLISAGAYNYSVIRTDNFNYSNIYDDEQFIISIITTSLSLAITPSNNEIYTVTTTATGSNCPSQLSCNLYRNGVNLSNPDNILLGYGSYTYIYNTTGNENYTSDSTTDTLTINQNLSSCQVHFNDTSPQTYPSVYTAFTDCTSAYTLTINNTPISNNSIQVLAVGSSNFSVLRTDSINYTDYFDDEWFTITIATGDGTLNLNGTATDKTIYRTDIALIEGTLDVGIGDIYIFINDTLFDSGASPLSDTKVFNTIGYYEINLTSLGSENYTSFVKYLYLNVSANPLADISIKYPLGSIYTARITELNYTVVNYTNCWYNLNEGGGNIPITCGVNVTNICSVSGSNTWTAFVNNTDGVVSHHSVVFTVNLPYEYDDLTKKIIQILQALIIFASAWVIIMTVKWMYEGEITLGRLIIVWIQVGLGFLALIFLGPIVIKYIISVIK